MQRSFGATASSAVPAMAVAMSRQSRLWHPLNAYTYRSRRSQILHITHHARFSTSQHVSDKQQILQPPFVFKGLAPRRFGPSQFQIQAFENEVQEGKQAPNSEHENKSRWKMSSLLDILPGILLGGVLGTILMPKKPMVPQKTQEERDPDTTKKQQEQGAKMKEEHKVKICRECEERYEDYYSRSVACTECVTRAEMDGENYEECSPCTERYRVYYDGAVNCGERND